MKRLSQTGGQRKTRKKLKSKNNKYGGDKMLMVKRQMAMISALVAVMLVAGALPAKVSADEAMDRIVIVVNDEVVTQREFDRVFLPIKRNIEENFTGSDMQAELKEAEAGVKDHLINAKLATSLAKKNNISIDEEELEKRIETIKRAYYGSEQEFLMALKERGTNLSEFEKEIRDQMLAQKLVREKVSDNIDVTPGEIKELYDAHKHEMVAPEQVLVRTIMVRKQKERSDADSRKKIEDLRGKAMRGEDFSALAREMSEGPYAGEGGNMGYVAAGQTVPQIDEVIFALEEGGISEVVETPIGYHIFLVDEKAESRMMELSEVNDFIRQQIFMQKFQQELAKYLEEQRRLAYISFK
jgi:parvulin-like peptidyl-prolyl isomerase